MDAHGGLFEREPEGFAFGPTRGADLGPRALVVIRMTLLVALFAAVTAAALYGLGYLVKLQLDRILLTG